MNKVRIIGDRSGRVWPLVLRDAEESRKAGRRLILYVPEQYTLHGLSAQVLASAIPL